MKHLFITTRVILVLIISGIFIFLNFQKTAAVIQTIDESANEQVEVVDSPYEECRADLYDCDDFETPEEAQKIFELCGPENIHNFHTDKMGVLCGNIG